MYLVLVAGGIASGKSTFARELERLGALRIDLDELSRDVLAQDLDLMLAIAEKFGPEVLGGEGQLDRRELARRAFASPEQAALLEALELPAIMGELYRRLAQAAARDDIACVVVEVPLLDRIDPEALGADEVVAVLAPSEARLRRAVERGMDEEDARARMANQPTDDWLRAAADVVVENDGDLEALFDAARSCYARAI